MKYDKINLNRTPLSADEINGAMDFDGLINPQATHAVKGGGKIIKLGFYSLAAAAVIAAGIYLWSTQQISSLTEQETGNRTTSIAMSDTDGEKETGPLINPPLKGYEKEFLTAKVNVAEGGTVKLGESTIEVPANAFLDVAGNLLNGEVELRYREFNDVLDIFLSGIPMEYDSAGVNYSFESNGMFELRGFQEGTEVVIAPEKDLEVKMEIAERMAGFSEYYLNEESGKWDFRNGQRYEEDLSLEEKSYSAVTVEKVEDVQWSGSELNRAEGLIYIDEFGEKQSVLYGNESKEEVRLKALFPGEFERVEELEKNIVSLEKEKKTKEKEKPTKPVVGNPELPQIDLDVNYEDFPELKAFKNTLFQVAEEDLDDFDSEWGQIAWTDMKISKSAKVGYYRLVFSKPGRREMVKAAPVLSEADMADALTTYDSLFDDYKTSLDSLTGVKKEKEAALVELRKKAKEEAKQRQLEYEQKVAEQQRIQKLRGEEKEAAIQNFRADQLDKESVENKERLKRVYAQQDLSAVFNVNGFGYYNCDSPQVFPKGKAVFAEYQNENEELIANNVTLIEKGKRAMFGMGERLKFNDSAENLLVTVSPNNRIAVLAPSEFKDINKRGSKKCVIKMKECDKELKSKSEIKEFINAQGFEI